MRYRKKILNVIMNISGAMVTCRLGFVQAYAWYDVNKSHNN
jgi:hypothetical protein